MWLQIICRFSRLSGYPYHRNAHLLQQILVGIGVPVAERCVGVAPAVSHQGSVCGIRQVKGCGACIRHGVSQLPVIRDQTVQFVMNTQSQPGCSLCRVNIGKKAVHRTVKGRHLRLIILIWLRQLQHHGVLIPQMKGIQIIIGKASASLPQPEHFRVIVDQGVICPVHLLLKRIRGRICRNLHPLVILRGFRMPRHRFHGIVNDFFLVRQLIIKEIIRGCIPEKALLIRNIILIFVRVQRVPRKLLQKPAVGILFGVFGGSRNRRRGIRSASVLIPFWYSGGSRLSVFSCAALPGQFLQRLPQPAARQRSSQKNSG